MVFSRHTKNGIHNCNKSVSYTHLNKKAKDLLGWKLDNSSIEYILKTALAWEKNKRY